MPFSSRPKNSILPSLGSSKPVMRLHTVVFQAAFGPIKLRIPRSGLIKLTFCVNRWLRKVLYGADVLNMGQLRRPVGGEGDGRFYLARPRGEYGLIGVMMMRLVNGV